MNILELPSEVLDMIVANAINDDFVQQLRVVRLICRRFAGLQSVMSKLFHSINFTGDFEQSIYLTAEALSASNIAPYVRHITFLPPLRCGFTFQEFEDVFKDQAKREYGCYQSSRPPRYQPSRPPRDLSKANRFWRKRPVTANLHSAKELKAGFEKYSAEERKSFAYMRSDFLQARVVAILAQCTRCKSFAFGLVDYNFIGLDFQPLKPKAVVNLSDQHYMLLCDFQMAASIADTYFRHIVKAMIGAECRPETLNFQQATLAEGSDWISSLHLDGLATNQLTHITLKPRSTTKIQDLTLRDTPDNYWLRNSSLGPSAFYSNSASTLEYLELRSASTSRWFLDDFFRPLPALKKLVLGPADIASDFFAAWLRVLPKLQDIVLEEVSFFDPGQIYEMAETEDITAETEDMMAETEDIIGVMKCVFDSMRIHPSLRRGELGFPGEGIYQCRFDKDAELSADDEETIAKADDEDLDVEERYIYDKWISLYVRGRIPWGVALEHKFGEQDY